MNTKRTVLIIDDDVAASQMEKLILERTGLYTVTVCNRGSEAMKVIYELRPDLVLLDVVMPDTDGTEIAAQIRDDRELLSTRVVFMTSLVSQQDTSGSSMIGGHPFIPKPITGEAFLKRVNAFFAQ